MIVLRDTYAPTAAERYAAWAYRWALLHGPRFNPQFTKPRKPQ